jgi:hypothetical protein
VARVELTAGTPQQSELYDAIPRRHTNRNPYDPSKPLSGDFVEMVRAVTSAEPDVRIFLFTDEKERKKIARMISQANDRVEVEEENQAHQSSDSLRQHI